MFIATTYNHSGNRSNQKYKHKHAWVTNQQITLAKPALMPKHSGAVGVTAYDNLTTDETGVS